MPKLRNAEDELSKFAQWIGRKCKNHHPLEELGLRGTAKLSNVYSAHSKGNVTLLADGVEAGVGVVYEAAGRAFVIEVKEVDPAEVKDRVRIPVGR